MGFAKREITPSFRFFGPFLGGYSPFHPALAVHDPLWVKSLALEDADGNYVVIVYVDSLGLLPKDIYEALREVKRGFYGRVFAGATHTHAAPDVLGPWGGRNKRYLSFVQKQIAGAADESLADLQEARLRFGQGELLGKAHGREENPADPTVSVIQILKKDGALITAVKWDCHADTGKSLYVSADFPFYSEQRLKGFWGEKSETMFVPGAIGGVQPTGDRLEDTELVGQLGEGLADAVWQIMKKPIKLKKINIFSEKLFVRAPFENQDNLRKAYDRGLLPADLLDSAGQVTAEVGRIVIGPAEILTVPGELFPKIWWRVKPRMRGQLRMIFGLVNGEAGYILLPEDYYSGKHEYHAGMSVGPKFGEEVEKGLKQLTSDH